ncbi:MAG: hypothetical protein LJE83_15545 [Gammaproteobacteria bacterium]|nr:hypothetical protein [Gammaproteobacteria bacterium]
MAELITEDASLKLKNDELDNIINQLSRSADDKAIVKVIALLKVAINKLEQKIWQQTPSKKNIKQYQDTFKALEKLYELKSSDERFNFMIVIPVADRPQHLKQCLDSLLTLCRSYEYGGFKYNRFTKISVLIADDSRDSSNIELHKKYCVTLGRKGLATDYFGRDEQLSLVNSITASGTRLTSIISDAGNIRDSAEFSHKGASIMRNITYLKLKQDLSATAATRNTLIYFIDSDQEFCINSAQSDHKYYAINYFHYLNEIFKTQNVSVLTGKVVGDPPVSPSVMAGNFQQDVKTFLNTIAGLNPQHSCQFHQHDKHTRDDAAYHDMANLFGFTSQQQAFNYHCTLQKKHNNADCLRDFSEKLEHFFYGEHPTRKTFFSFENGFTATAPARTVYTGNYVIRPDALKFFIPFATLKLRMAGPVLGRILKKEINTKFVSANLPMLHNRTVESIGQSEFRAGVKNNERLIDLGNEFIRQFYGDVMLFIIEKITAEGFPGKNIGKDRLRIILDETYIKIKDNYIEKHHTILSLKAQIRTQLSSKDRWWNNTSTDSHTVDTSLANFNSFLNNIQSNFDEDTNAYQQITLPCNAKQHLEKILDAMMNYSNDLQHWNKILNSQATHSFQK